MVWRSLLCRHAIKKLPRHSLAPPLFYFDVCKTSSTTALPTFLSVHSFDHSYGFTTFVSHRCLNSISSFSRHLHSTALTRPNNLEFDPKVTSKVEDEEANVAINEFLSQVVWIMRKKLIEAYPASDKQTIDGMLLIIVGKVVSELEKGGLQPIMNSAASASQDFSEDLWRTVWEVSNTVLDDMNKERKKERMKGFLQCEEVKEMCRFAGEIGVRGTLLRELRFKWAREKMEEHEFYESLERLRKEAQAEENVKTDSVKVDAVGETSKTVTLPKRRGKINYKIYGLNLSDPKWAEVADRIHEAEELIWPPEPKLLSGKAKLITDKIISLNEMDDPSSLIAEWVEIHQPSRIDWVNLLDKLKEKNVPLYLKVSEIALTEKSFQTNIWDYSKLISVYAEESKYDDTERILKKMSENGFLPDAIIANTLIHMYAKAGNFDRAKEAFESLRSQGVQPDMKIYNAMIMSYVNAGQPKMGEILLRELETGEVKPSYEIYLALFRSFAHLGDVNGALRISTSMQFAGFQATMETCTLLVEAYERADNPDMARTSFDYMIKVGFKPDDRVTASMISAYERKNLLDKALNLLLKLEQDGFEPGIATNTVLVDWFAKMQLVDEAEQLLGKIAQQGEAPPLKIQVSLCDMYARLGNEKKALQALGVLEARKDQLRQDEFERIIRSLLSGGFVQHARRIRGIMEAQGFTPSQPLEMAFRGADRGGRRPVLR
ncbi:pentatricopeptide repeat-containing protein At1g03560, mitochondrial [Neltuma alba]|uniref:pentatricopeptide repeat-containing protein At1g03560, mitochondrial n=1 Tax=Neltuma alba TaxID=207710 RepID=UPI0010A5257D|nr:pentatricopeptide repeat-containing protein At1g03560, mitochondrial-like [Prosopis alba]XP_028804162.1 pentatricopeptide repeat-containing protein At1g03560, mitochondrial-like [Prosopis alba]